MVAAAIHYRVECADRNAHLFAVTLRIERPAASQRVSLPVWIPGSYLVREFSKNLQQLQANQGRRKLAVFEDPNCGYCKQFERDLTKVDNVTIHLFLYPVLGPDSVVKSRNIWCAKDKAKAWADWMQRGVTPEPAECDTAALTRNREFGQKYNITGTPTLIFSDGTRAPGAIPAAQVEKQLAAIN